MSNENQPLKILLITGPDRSGSTLLEMIVGSMNGMVPMGEVTYIWDRGFKKNQLCSCGKRFKDCEFWENVREYAFPNREKFPAEVPLKLNSYVARNRKLPYYLLKPLFSDFHVSVRTYAEYILRIYRGVFATNECRVLIDSSKNIHGHILADMPEIYLYVLHLVRDARATTYSWTRTKIYENRREQETYMPRLNPLTSVWYWIFNNISAECLRLRCKRYMRIKYEEFTVRPYEVLQRIFSFIEEPYSVMSPSENFKFLLKTQHCVSGNPVRFSKGQITIRADRQWETAMSKKDKLLVKCLAWPLLLRYGYFARRQG